MVGSEDLCNDTTVIRTTDANPQSKSWTQGVTSQTDRRHKTPDRHAMLEQGFEYVRLQKCAHSVAGLLRLTPLFRAYHRESP